MEDIQRHHHQPCKLSRITSNSRNDSNKIARNGSAAQHPQQQKQDAEDEEAADRAFQASRIFKVSKASGGKDRHSKVLTTKGVRDRRVRLSVSTAIQFYDLQDRLGYDQPSKAVEWLIKAADNAITQLPSLNAAVLYAPKQPSDDKRIHRNVNSEPRLNMAETTTNDEEQGKPDEAPHYHHISSTSNRQLNFQSSSFTELLTGAQQNNNSYSSFGFSTQTDYGSVPQVTPCSMELPPPPFTVTADQHNSHHQQNQKHLEMRQFSILSEHLIPDTAEGKGEWDLIWLHS